MLQQLTIAYILYIYIYSKTNTTKKKKKKEGRVRQVRLFILLFFDNNHLTFAYTFYLFSFVFHNCFSLDLTASN